MPPPCAAPQLPPLPRALALARRARERLEPFLADPRNVAWTLLSLAVVAALQEYLLGPKPMGDGVYTHFNNYRIYERSFRHLAAGLDLYVRYPAEHWDLFKYSPTFAALMAPFSALPDVAGLVLWNLLNAAVFVLALATLPILSPRDKALLGLLLVPDFLTAVQNTQANVLVAGLVLLAFCLLEKGRPEWAALAIACGFYVKLYPAIGALAFVLYPRRLRFLGWLGAWLLALGAVPLAFVPPDRLRALYESWFRVLLADREAFAGLSVMGILHGWFGLDPPKTLVVLAGGAVLLLPALNVAAWGRPAFRLLFVASLLVWMVIFNHAAESATFFIAMCGVGLWWFVRPRGRKEGALLASAVLLTSMSPRLPALVVEHVIQPYALKALPCLAVWIAIVVELASSRGDERAVLAKRAVRPA
ncbi:MAG TPA: glycosyltransferase family 87 protein [Anaeromyxobacter sp.]|nr:glycosyltransferase family 87 protein [Anaeromyxobacter sp.]